ncbi:SET and MYND domain containing class 4 member 4 [Carabus blaptoides fortunei]
MDVLPEVKINRNSTEHQIFTKYFKNIDQNVLKELINKQPEKGKDIELSTEYRKEGNTYYEEKNYAAAMSSYTTSLTLAPRDTTEYALTLGNRSAVLYVLKRYKKASKAVQNAKTTFEIAKVTLKNERSEVLVKEMTYFEKCLENHPETEEIVDEQEPSSLPELTAGENLQFAYASNAVAIRKNKQIGRHVVASVDIKKGDVLFVEEPYSTDVLLFRKTYFTYCSECFTSSLTCIPCTYCCLVIFCSDECRHVHWYTRHRWECAAVRRSVISKELSLALGVLFRVSHTGFNTIIRNTRVYGNKVNNYPYVNQLMTHKYSMPQETYTGYVKAAAWLVVYLIHFTDYFECLHDRHKKLRGSGETLHRMVGGLLLKFLSQHDTNKDIINNVIVAREDKYGIGLKRNQLACALYVSSSALNHACLPNTVKSFHGKTKVVRAISDINQGIEITVCYVDDPNMYLPELRRKQLREEYYFTCSCCACADDNSLFPWLCRRCRGRAFTTSDEQIAECMDCQHTFQLDKYTQLKERTEFCVVRYLYTRDFRIMQEALAIMSRIYHETNFALSIGYTKSLHECEQTDDIKSSIMYVELLVDLYQAIYQPASEEHVKILLKYCLTLVHYCLSLKYKKPGLYKLHLNQAKEAIDNTTELLQYHMCEKRAVNYQQNMLRMLDVGDNVNKAIQLYHYNIINA